ncbi:MAG TPA: tetratricopeptide repeat protein [Gemmataceae bacterium]|nr:tetratricopeptide repeat protein [Gemmataceae bacterium]
MEASTNQGKFSLPSPATASANHEEPAAPLKLQLEVTLPPGLSGELRAWRQAFERFAQVMERWLENSLAHPGLPQPPAMPWTPPPAHQPQPAPPSPAPVAPNGQTPAPLLPPSPPPAPPVPIDVKPILPEEMPLLMVDGTGPFYLSGYAAAEKIAPTRKAEVSPPPAPSESAKPAVALAALATAEQAASQAQLGERYRAAGQKEKALVCYREALDADPDCTQAYLGRASVFIEQGRLNEALLDCNAALRREPQRAILYVLRGLVYVRLGNLKRALVEAEDAIRCDPRLPSAYMLRGNVHFKKGTLGEALADMKTAIRLRPNDAKFYSELGRLLIHMGHHAQAARIYAKVLELSPDFHEARLQRGVALRQAGETSAAEAELTAYLRHRPRTAAAHYQRGLCRLAQRNYVQATADFDKAIDLNPNDTAAYQAKEKTLEQWEGTARQPRSTSGSAATVARAATATVEPPALPTRTDPVISRPTPKKTRPAPTKPSRSPRRRWDDDDDDDEPGPWVRHAKWACAVVLVGMLGYFFVPVVWAYVKVYSIPQEDKIPIAEAKVTATELWGRYLTNPSSAQSQFGSKFIEVRGIVQEVKQTRTGDKDIVQIVLVGDRYGGRIVCTLVPTKSLNQGVRLSRVDQLGSVKLIGKCTGLADKSVNLDEVRLIEVRSR